MKIPEIVGLLKDPATQIKQISDLAVEYFARALLAGIAAKQQRVGVFLIQSNDLAEFIREAVREEVETSTEFPKCLYRNGDKPVTVANEEEQKALLDKGWNLVPTRTHEDGWPRWFGRWSGGVWAEKVLVNTAAEAQELGPSWTDLNPPAEKGSA